MHTQSNYLWNFYNKTNIELANKGYIELICYAIGWRHKLNALKYKLQKIKRFQNIKNKKG